MLSKGEWKQEAERAAARKMGEDNAGWFFFRRFLAAPLAVVGLAAAVALGVRWLWSRATDAVGGFSAPDSSTSSAAWFVLGGLVIVTAVAFRPREMPTPAHILLLKLIVFGLAWLGTLAYLIAYWLS